LKFFLLAMRRGSWSPRSENPDMGQLRNQRKNGLFWLKVRPLGLKNGQKLRFSVTDKSTGKNYKLLNPCKLHAMEGSINDLHRVGGVGSARQKGRRRAESFCFSAGRGAISSPSSSIFNMREREVIFCNAGSRFWGIAAGRRGAGGNSGILEHAPR
jgi:hypothetical protein